MATLNGARALGQPGRLGQLSSGALADLIALPLVVKPGHATDAVLEYRGAVAASMIDGQWAVPPL
jgi:cytosine/adenosine deaminase-related metal-dependent hydrolase